MQDTLTSLAAIVVFGIGAQWLAWRLHLPSILLLLLFGFVAGPLTSLVVPSKLLGEDQERLLLPLVSLSVALILFEGGLSLRLSELRGVGRVVRNLITVGVLITWATSALAAHWILGFDLWLAVLLGSILVVTGPTVIMPLLRHVHPIGASGSILKWEGIVIDPVGVTLAVLVFEAIDPGHAGAVGNATGFAALSIVKTLAYGGGCGAIGAAALVLVLRRYWVPDFLHNPVTLMAVFVVFTISNHLQAECGLLAVTVMGIALANQRAVDVRHIVEFKENLRVLLISSLFIVLAARMEDKDLESISLSSLAFLGVLVLVARPLAVFASAARSGLSWQEKVFISWMAPRGIVAAAVASVFALRLVEQGYSEARAFVPLTFLVIIGTVAFYGLTAAPVARWLGVARPDPQGVLFVGAHPWARQLAKALVGQGFHVVLADTNWSNLSAARMDNLPTYYGNAISEDALYEIDFTGVGRLFALTPNHEVNTLAALHYMELFGRPQVYQLAATGSTREASLAARGRILFGPDLSYSELAGKFERGVVVKTTKITREFDAADFTEHYFERSIPLFLITENRKLVIGTADSPVAPKPGQTLISLVDPGHDESPENASSAPGTT